MEMMISNIPPQTSLKISKNGGMLPDPKTNRPVRSFRNLLAYVSLMIQSAKAASLVLKVHVA